MKLSRREFIERSAGTACLLAAGCGAAHSSNNAVLVNQLGFVPKAAKACVVAATVEVPFTVLDTRTGARAYRGVASAVRGDLGNYAAGRFDQLQTPGEYQIEAGGKRSLPFTIGPAVYSDAIQKSISYFARQRCGDGKTGYHSPCHLDDGIRSDNHLHQDVSGGWHDACDLRKWVDATIYGMIGLSRVLDLELPSVDRAAVLEELRWGNQYFRKMQEPDGYVMFTCGGDDGNNFTDNVVGTQDDRVIHVQPAGLPAQFQFVAAQAALARHVGKSDVKYAQGCIEAARRCLNWCIHSREAGAALTLGAAASACAEMDRATGDRSMSDLAAGFLRKLIALQVIDVGGAAGVGGFFLKAPDDRQPLRDISLGNLPLLALCDALKQFPGHSEAPSWRNSLELHCRFLASMAGRSAFGTIPFGLYDGADPGGGRRIGTYWYRWFMKTQGETAAGDWWVGINCHLASNGVGLMRAGRLLGDPRLGDLGQRQLDWILGVNPFDATTISGVGQNQPTLYRPGSFSPPTPQMDGGVMNGIGGDENDRPTLLAGSWNTCEYWTPMVAYAMWLCGELQGGAA
ncbi:MAG TPA: glycoside hydrolase family 9 protein [Tepidisphaeraceae bacterium]|nr:glycoside hydrolase family 9 protein [Tepidisphaeraceae bacterium]